MYSEYELLFLFNLIYQEMEVKSKYTLLGRDSLPSYHHKNNKALVLPIFAPPFFSKDTLKAFH